MILQCSTCTQKLPMIEMSFILLTLSKRHLVVYNIKHCFTICCLIQKLEKGCSTLFIVYSYLHFASPTSYREVLFSLELRRCSQQSMVILQHPGWRFAWLILCSSNDVKMKSTDSLHLVNLSLTFMCPITQPLYVATNCAQKVAR